MKTTLIRTTLCIAATMMCTPLTAYAEHTGDYTREEIIEEYWTDAWEDSLPGEENPEGSLEYHILESFLDEQYGHRAFSGEGDQYTVSDWSSKNSIRKAWQDYREEYTKYWHYVDDEETGEFYIESYDPVTDTSGGDKLYTFEFVDGNWNMIDSNGNVADTFEPHGGDGSWDRLKNEDKEEKIDDFIAHMGDDESDEDSADSEEKSEEIAVQAEDGNNTPVTPDTAAKADADTEIAADTKEDTTEESTAEEAVSDSKNEKAEENSSISTDTVIGIATAVCLAGGIAGGVIFQRKKKKGNKK